MFPRRGRNPIPPPSYKPTPTTRDTDSARTKRAERYMDGQVRCRAGDGDGDLLSGAGGGQRLGEGRRIRGARVPGRLDHVTGA